MEPLHISILRWTLLVVPSASASFMLSQSEGRLSTTPARLAIACGVAVVIAIVVALDRRIASRDPVWSRHLSLVVALFGALQIAGAIPVVGSLLSSLLSPIMIAGMIGLGLAGSVHGPIHDPSSSLHALDGFAATVIVGMIWTLVALGVSRVTRSFSATGARRLGPAEND